MLDTWRSASRWNVVKKFSNFLWKQGITTILNFVAISSKTPIFLIYYFQTEFLLCLEANQNKNNCLVSNFYNKLKFPALFSVRNSWEKRTGDFKNPFDTFFRNFGGAVFIRCGELLEVIRYAIVFTKVNKWLDRDFNKNFKLVLCSTYNLKYLWRKRIS